MGDYFRGNEASRTAPDRPASAGFSLVGPDVCCMDTRIDTQRGAKHCKC
jgi:hypothetical protein